MSQTKTKSKGRPTAISPRASTTAAPPAATAVVTPRRMAVILTCLFALGVLLRLQHVDDVVRRTPDEAMYGSYASQIAEHGVGIFPALMESYNRDSRLQLYPPPTRIAHLSILAGVMKLRGSTDIIAGVWLAFLGSLVSLVLLGWVAYRFLPPLAAIYAMLYLAFSLPELVEARRCWQDGVVGLVGLTLVWCVCEIVRDPDRWWPYAVLIGWGSLSVLMKELMAFVYVWCALFVLAVLIRRRAWRTLGIFVAGGLIGAGVSVFSLTRATGGLDQLMTVWGNMTATAKVNPYNPYQSGPWYRWIWGFWIINPVNTVLGLVAVGLAATPRRVLNRWGLAWEAQEVSRLRFFASLTLVLATLMGVLEGTQNFRYMAPAYGAMYFLGGLGLWAGWQLAQRRWGGMALQAVATLGVIVVLGGAVMSYMDFERVYVTGQVPDLSIKMVVDSR